MTQVIWTDGIRARAGEFPLNAAAIVGDRPGHWRKAGGTDPGRSGHALSSPWIFDLLQEGIRQTSAPHRGCRRDSDSRGRAAHENGHFAGGVMISASHNPFDDNGIKVFSSDGTKVNDADEIAIEKRIAEILHDGDRAGRSVDTIPDQRYSARQSDAWPERYEELLLSHFPKGSG